MNVCAKNWLAKHYNTSIQHIDNLLKDEKATSYLLIWSVFEQEIFDGYMRIKDIKSVSVEFAKYSSVLGVDNIAEKFHIRYQNHNNYKHLIHDQDYAYFKAIIDKSFADISQIEILEMLFFIVYRYRNNIFHGNKKVLAWTQYTEQIEDCLAFITKILDLNEKETIIKRNGVDSTAI